MNALLDALTRLGFDWHVALANTFNFFLIFFILKYFFFGTIKKTLSDRSSKIEKGLRDAEEAAHALSIAEAEKKEIVLQAHSEASSILLKIEEKSNELASSIEKKANEKAVITIQEAKTKADKIIEATDIELRSKVPALAAEMVEKILKQKMNETENNGYIKMLASK